MTANPQLAALRIELRERFAYTSYRRDYLRRLRVARQAGSRIGVTSIVHEALLHRGRAGIGKQRCVLTGRPYLEW